MSNEISRPVAVACQHLRSKGMYVTGCLNPEEEDGEVGDGYCWCNRTQGMIGPDDGLVSRGGCAAERACYQAVL
jgi:hypothetical protein